MVSICGKIKCRYKSQSNQELTRPISRLSRNHILFIYIDKTSVKHSQRYQYFIMYSKPLNLKTNITPVRLKYELVSERHTASLNN